MATEIVVRNVNAGYGRVRVLNDFSLCVSEGEVVALLGTNGNGKTTVMRVLMGMLRPYSGSVTMEVGGRKLVIESMAPEAIVASGVALVPEGRHLFSGLTVEENLMLGAYRPEARVRINVVLSQMFETFPVLKERKRQLAGSMSGGEQQMLALARALMSSPRILLIDEPSVGLAPIYVARVIEKIRELKEMAGLTVLMAEQNFSQAIRVADRGYVIVHGEVAGEGTATELGASDLVRRCYLGESGAHNRTRENRFDMKHQSH